MHEIGIESSLVEAIRSGEKTIEGRLGTPKLLDIKEGDTLSVREDIWREGEIIGSHEEHVALKVTQVLYFENFTEMFQAVNYEAVIPAAKNAEEARAVYDTFYNDKDELEYGVVALFFELL